MMGVMYNLNFRFSVFLLFIVFLCACFLHNLKCYTKKKKKIEVPNLDTWLFVFMPTSKFNW